MLIEKYAKIDGDNYHVYIFIDENRNIWFLSMAIFSILDFKNRKTIKNRINPNHIRHSEELKVDIDNPMWDPNAPWINKMAIFDLVSYYKHDKAFQLLTWVLKETEYLTKLIKLTFPVLGDFKATAERFGNYNTELCDAITLQLQQCYDSLSIEERSKLGRELISVRMKNEFLIMAAATRFDRLTN